jgi:hypothetical protein
MTFEEEFEAAPLKDIFISVKGPRADRNAGYDPGRAIEGAFKEIGNQVIMCDAHGREVIDSDGRKYRHTLKSGSGELNEREAASIMVKDIKAKFKIGGERVGGFEHGPLRYPRGYGGSIW